MFAGVGGAHLSIAYTKSWFENMAQGRGFVAVAVVMFAARQPFKVAAGAYLFGAALALSPALQARGYGDQPVRPRRRALRRHDPRADPARQAAQGRDPRRPVQGLRAVDEPDGLARSPPTHTTPSATALADAPDDGRQNRSTREHQTASHRCSSSAPWRSPRAARTATPATRPATTAAGAATTAATAAGRRRRRRRRAPASAAKKIGFIFVGPKDDYGYNQAAYEGSQAVAAAHPDLEVVTAENVPEDDNATRVMEKMIDDGAKIIFATSYGHLDPALKVAADHPDVVVVQQGNVISGTVPANAGTYFGTVYEPVYLAGIAAGKATKSNKLGYVYAFPIPQTIANINAFQLGAQSVNPDVQTYVVNTSNWCDPAKQAEAAKSLFAQGVDVITQHQDCTATITKAAEEAGKMVVGYHADASALAPDGLGHRLRVGLGRAVQRHRRHRARRRASPARSTTPTTGSASRTAPTRSSSRSSGRWSTPSTQATDRQREGADLDDRLAVRRSGRSPRTARSCSPTARCSTTPRSSRRTPSSSRASSARSPTS